MAASTRMTMMTTNTQPTTASMAHMYPEALSPNREHWQADDEVKGGPECRGVCLCAGAHPRDPTLGTPRDHSVLPTAPPRLRAIDHFQPRPMVLVFDYLLRRLGFNRQRQQRA
jgi:hypothetical protein